MAGSRSNAPLKTDEQIKERNETNQLASSVREKRDQETKRNNTSFFKSATELASKPVTTIAKPSTAPGRK